jgi:glycerol-3-phosphate dehydrogenase (NAD(P)+)
VNIAVLGAGAWGTALAVVLSSRHRLRLWVRDPGRCAQMLAERENRRYLPGIALPPALDISADLAYTLEVAELAILGVTVAGLRPTLRGLSALDARVPVIWLCKGFEAGSARLPHQVADEELPPEVLRGVLSGPSFAQEVARGNPAAVTLAASNLDFAGAMARELHGPRLRVYSSDDITGVEVGGAVKNVMAIAAGISDGLSFGASARAALITRGLAEIARLGVALGGRAETFMGLSGVGDLILTCTGDLSRNRQVGLRLATGKPLAEILGELGHVAEGVHSAREVLRLAQAAQVDVPIVRAVCAVLYEGLAPQAAVEMLMARAQKNEQLS